MFRLFKGSLRVLNVFYQKHPFGQVSGHMVMSTLHTNSAPETLTRLRNMGVPAFNLATSINLIVAQRLARRLCDCKELLEIPKNALLEKGFSEAEIESGLEIFG